MEKVIKGLACCIKQGEQGILDCDSDCPYGEHGNRLDCWIKMNRDALALLKEQGTANVYKCPNCGTWVSAENVVNRSSCVTNFQKHETKTGSVLTGKRR